MQEKTEYSSKELPTQVDKPFEYIGQEAFAHAFDEEIKQILHLQQLGEGDGDPKVRRSWFVADKGELLWFDNRLHASSYQFNVAGREQNATTQFSAELTDSLQRLHIEKFLYLVAALVPSEKKLPAITSLTEVTLSENLESQLVLILKDALGTALSAEAAAKITRLQQINVLAASGELATNNWNAKDVPPKHFNLLPFIENSISAESDTDILQEVRNRLSKIPATKTPDQLQSERLVEALRITAEFVNTKDIVGGVDTRSNWADILEQRRPGSSITDLVKIFQEGDFYTADDNEISLWRVKQNSDDVGLLFVKEGNHRVAVLKALEVTKFPARIHTVILPQT